MNTHPSYTLGSRPQTGRYLRARAVLLRGTFAAAIFLTDTAFIVAMSCLTGIAYHLAAYGKPGNITLFTQVGVLAASIFAVSHMYRGEYRLPNFCSFKPHLGRTIQVWNVTLICLLMVGFLAQTSVEYSRAWIVLFYVATLTGPVGLRFFIVRVTALARAAGLISAQRIFLIGTGANGFVNRYRLGPAQHGGGGFDVGNFAIAPASSANSLKSSRGSGSLRGEASATMPVSEPADDSELTYCFSMARTYVFDSDLQRPDRPRETIQS
jgi:CoA-binding domain